MKKRVYSTIYKTLPLIDKFLFVFIYPAALILWGVRRAGIEQMKFCKKALFSVGVFPIIDHYYEPQFNHTDNSKKFYKPRKILGINWNEPNQLAFLNKLKNANELGCLKHEKESDLKFYFNNGNFYHGDAEYWYQIVRYLKPKRIIEIGSGSSTLLAIDAIKMNKKLEDQYACEHICIEPFEKSWLEETNVKVIREKVENIDIAFFDQLEAGDILFIDSSHVIRPHGDILFEYFEILPRLNKGVTVHIHDIFSPKDYPERWIKDDVKLWNEQYLLEAFLINNNEWEIVGALSMLHHKHHEKLKKVAPFLCSDDNPGSFYMRKL